MRIQYCEECNKRVTDGDISEGTGVRTGDLVYCEECAKAKGIRREPPAERYEAKASRQARPTSRRSRAERPVVRGMPGWVYAAGLVAALVLVVLVAVSLRGNEPRERPRRVSVPSRPLLPDMPTPVPKAEAVTPAPETDVAPARVPEPAAPVAAPAAAATVPGKGNVLFLSDFERDANGWEHGKRVEDGPSPAEGLRPAGGSLPGSRWAYQSTLVPNEFFARRVMLIKHLLRPKRDSIFETGKGLCVVFDYFVSGDAASPIMEVVLGLVAAGPSQNWRHDVEGVVKDRWSTVKLSVMEDFLYNPEKGRRMPAGASVKELKIGVGPANAKLELRVDNVRVIDAGAVDER